MRPWTDGYDAGMPSIAKKKSPSSKALTPIVRTTLTSDICQKMVNHLLRGIWVAGERLPAERELCQSLGVGRASLREALKGLEIMGMIETRLGDGTYVCKRSEFLSRPLLWAIASGSEAEAQELVEARTVLEVELAGMAAERRRASDVARITEELEKMVKAKDDPQQFVQADVDFHLAIGQAACNRILMNALQLSRNLLSRWIVSAASVNGVPEKACAQHRRLLTAIEKRDATSARKEMKQHLKDMAAFVPKKHS